MNNHYPARNPDNHSRYIKTLMNSKEDTLLVHIELQTPPTLDPGPKGEVESYSSISSSRIKTALRSHSGDTGSVLWKAR
ncbi:hypothetical protein BC826DRAFT_1054726 [Russula brevipes]|nr:hypothetical protein BC826DRAFT_1054726 [Russula brevipes]